MRRHIVRAYHNTVIPGENRQLIQPSNKIPPRGNVSRYKDTKSEDGKGVHESRRLRVSVSAFFQIARIAEEVAGMKKQSKDQIVIIRVSLLLD